MAVTDIQNSDENFCLTSVVPPVIRPEVPQNPQNRKRTDTWFLFVFIITIIIVLICVIVYTTKHSHGKILEMIYHSLIDITAIYFIISILASLGISVVLIILLRHATAVAVWVVLILSWSLLPIHVVQARHYLQKDATIFFIIISVLLFLAMISNARKINRNTFILQEATKALFHVKTTFIIMIIVLFVYFLITLTLIYLGMLLSLPSNTEFFLNIAMFIWVFSFVDGILNMTVSLAVARWYFPRNNNNFNNVGLSSLWITLKYHLGTIALVSLLSAITAIPIIILKCLAQFKVMKTFVDFCMDYMNGCFSKNVYILTAVYGLPYSQSAKKGLTLFRQSIGDTKAVFYFGELIIVFSQILIALFCSVFINILVIHLHPEFEYGVSLIFLMFLICTNVILKPVEVATNTIFICTTEELLNNRETHMPHSMTEREFLDGSNNLFFRSVQNKCFISV